MTSVGCRSFFYIAIFFVVIFFISSQEALALEENEKLWVAITVERPFSEDKKWLYLLYTQTRFINQSHPWQSTLFEGGMGRVLSINKSLWLGYRWSAHDPNNGFYQENRFWQQFVWAILTEHHYTILSRTRLEESTYSHDGQFAYRLRQRLSWVYLDHYWGGLSPLYYDEFFFQLNQTNNTPHHFFSQNRLFVGFKLPLSASTFWEIGYINQYQLGTPQNNQNQMNHVLSATYHFV